MKDILQQVRGMFEANNCEVVMVDKPQFKHDDKEFTVYSRRCAKNWAEDISNDVDEFNVEKVYLLSAEFIKVEDTERLVIRVAYSETL